MTTAAAAAKKERAHSLLHAMTTTAPHVLRFSMKCETDAVFVAAAQMHKARGCQITLKRMRF
jgi:hypothetical protein